MSYGSDFHTNVSFQPPDMMVERAVVFSLSTVPCCVFLFINGTMLFTLRSKPVFRETSRYILLYNLLFADTALLAQSHNLFLVATCRVQLTYPVCGFLVMITNLTTEISPLTLVFMSLERYVAVCYPLRHATIVTIRNTGVAIAAVWVFSSLNVFIRVMLLLQFPFHQLESLQMRDFCHTTVIFLGPLTDQYDKAYTGFVFVSATVAIISSYIGVMVAARSASADEASAQKARKTLLLHLVQLGLSLFSTMHNSFLLAIAKVVSPMTLVHIVHVFYVFIILLPRCLSALIYGLRDQTIRPVLINHLCCRLKLSVVFSNNPVSSQNVEILRFSTWQNAVHVEKWGIGKE